MPVTLKIGRDHGVVFFAAWIMVVHEVGEQTRPDAPPNNLSPIFCLSSPELAAHLIAQ